MDAHGVLQKCLPQLAQLLQAAAPGEELIHAELGLLAEGEVLQQGVQQRRGAAGTVQVVRLPGEVLGADVGVGVRGKVRRMGQKVDEVPLQGVLAAVEPDPPVGPLPVLDAAAAGEPRPEQGVRHHLHGGQTARGLPVGHAVPPPSLRNMAHFILNFEECKG